MMRGLARLAVTGTLLLGLGGCGGDDEDGAEPVAPAPTTEAAPAPATTAPEPEQSRKPRYRRTPSSLADCIGAQPGISETLVKGAESEDVTFFADLAGGQVDVLGVTAEGEAAELTVVLFESEDAAGKAAPSAGGGGVSAEARGSALVLAPPGADTAPIDACLEETGYAGG